MGKGRPRAVEKGVLGQNSCVSLCGSLNIPSGPVYYPTEDEFRDPLVYIYKIRPEAEPYGICRIVPPKSWKPPFGLNLDSFEFPTKTQAIHQLQARPASCDSKTFELEYNRFLEDHSGKKLTRKVVFEGEELDLCKLFNAVKRYGGYDKVMKEKKWGDVSQFVTCARKISECAKHVLSQLYREHLYDYEIYYNQLNQEPGRTGKRGMHKERRSESRVEHLGSKRRRKNNEGEKVKVCKVEEEEHDQICERCKSGLHGEVMLLCDRCDKGWHIYCLSPPLKQVPLGNWYCLDCLNSDKDSFGFVPGKHYTIESFRRVADRAKKKWFGSGSASRMQIEKKFWEIVEGSVGEVEVMYGSDLDTSIYGSGFPRIDDQRPESVEAKVWDEYCSSPWNLNNLPKLKGSVLRAVHHNIAGVMVPWLYIGMLFSSFCWHFEDHCFYSMNYLHWGEPKCWYSVPGSEADAFEKVMHDCLPDLFEAEPDLLFQLVTMLNPSVLQENRVPVYSVLQEPGNFVITFPRSYHGGFNLGLNCAEAVNFAPADWLPHGRFGAELYQLYRKTAVLSHDELLCALAKIECDSRIAPYLKKELVRIYEKEKTWREKVWKNGIVKSSPMPPRKCPEYVGTEEDSTCIICKQYLYLSAVVCRCRPLAFVCLEHWERLCECKSYKRCLLYRHSLAELNDLALAVDKYCSDETTQSRNVRRQISSSNKPRTLSKKVKGGQVTLNQLAEQWLMRSGKIFQNMYSRDVYVAAIKEAQQFLWAGEEMEPVRNVARNLVEARKWAESIRQCVSKCKKWSQNQREGLEKVHLDHINELLSADPMPCNEPRHIKLKDYAEKARILKQEINTALLESLKVLNISELELLYCRAEESPVHVKESEKLSQKISAAKVWLENITKCLSEKDPATVEVEFLYKLKSEILELQIQFPETEMLWDLLKQAESCRARCNEVLRHPINLKDVVVFLQEMDSFTVNLPELKLLREYHADAVSWISRFNDILLNYSEREDQNNVVAELTCILKDGASLKIQVDELPLVEVELQKACCREKALKARNDKMSMDFLRQLIIEATQLHIDREKLFVDMSEVLDAALRWEERATDILSHEADLSDFEVVIRGAEDLCVLLPSLNDVKEALSMAVSWLKSANTFLVSCSPLLPVSSPLLKFEALQELVSQSKLLKVSLRERRIVETVLKDCEEWKSDAGSLLQDVRCLFDTTNICDGLTGGLISNIGCLVTRIESVKKTGLSFGLDLDEIPKLEDACSTLQWCEKALSLCSNAPPFKDVENLMKASELLPCTFASGNLWSSLIDAVKWLRQVFEVVSVHCNSKRCSLSDAEELLAISKRVSIYPAMVAQLGNAIQKHKSWQEQAHRFFNLEPRERCWALILQLKEVGVADAFGCSELELVLTEVDKVEKWKQSCINILGFSVEDENSLLAALKKIAQTIERSFCICDKSCGSEVRDFCLCCCSDFWNQEFLTCSICKDCYHLRCLGSEAAGVGCSEVYKCPYCLYLVVGSISLKGGGPLKYVGKRPELKMLVELLPQREDFCVRIEEREILEELVGKALTCKTRLTEIVETALAFVDKDLCMISGKLAAALKATEVAGVYDHEVDSNLKLAVARNIWKLQVDRLLQGLQKPTMQQILRRLKEGLMLKVPPEDHFRKKLMEVKRVGTQWADYAKKVAADSGALGLDKVFDLVSEGENLPVHLEKELKLLRARSMLYCICRRPYGQRAMIACDECDEWYHFDCIKLVSAPKIYICPACKPLKEGSLTPLSADHERSSDAKFVEPKTPSPQHTKSRKKPRKAESSLTQKKPPITDQNNTFGCSSGIERLWWRNRKPFRRAAKKRSELETLSFFPSQH